LVLTRVDANAIIQVILKIEYPSGQGEQFRLQFPIGGKAHEYQHD